MTPPCTHREPDTQVWQDVEVDWRIEPQGQWVLVPGKSLFVDISIGAFKCVRCGTVGYYTGLWRAYHEEGIPCLGSHLERRLTEAERNPAPGPRTPPWE